jgi:hypothetical protein
MRTYFCANIDYSLSIEGNANCSRLKIYLERDFAAGVYLSVSEARNPIQPPPSYLLYRCIQYSILIHTEKGGRGEC